VGKNNREAGEESRGRTINSHDQNKKGRREILLGLGGKTKKKKKKKKKKKTKKKPIFNLDGKGREWNRGV